MVSLDSVFDGALLDEMLQGRFVKCQRHPDAGLRIFNYTALAQFQKVWNPVTLACRGLIVDDAGRVVARPFAKFFNLAEHPSEMLPDGEVHVTEKLDGSLGVLYPSCDGFAVATRGSFTSEQATHATQVWRERYADRFVPDPRWTYLFEVIYPGNRVVVDYGDLDDLVLLGAVDIATGRSVPLAECRAGWPGPVVEEYPYRTLADALSIADPGNAEGVVIHFVDADLRVKVKHADYVRLHRIITGVSERRIWEALSEGVDLNPWLEAIPDEFYAFVTGTRDRLLAAHAELCAEVDRRFDATLVALGAGWSRREFAAAVAAQSDWPLARALFLRLDGKPVGDLVWRVLRPAEHVPVWGVSEDVS